ncbi:MAG: sigma-70 family RNA polymerase sigma factor [Bacteroidetes bacterium]|nr:sigma-70 family RNA polymerase sigma factor [Bacteroidota bacterium]
MSEKNVLTDQELIEMIRHGKQSALIRLHKQCYDGIRNHILRNRGTDNDVDDIIQDALVITWQKVISPDFILTAKLSTYVHSVAKFLWMNKLRKEGREVLVEEIHEGGVPMWVERNHTSMDMKIIRSCMDEIGETCKTLLGLFYFDGYAMDKIAQMMDLANADTAKSKKYQCLKKLESIIKLKYKKEDFL